MADKGTTSGALPKSLRILCFGDSLTAGYTMCGYEHYPYADHLRAGLEHMLSSSHVDVEVAGLSGDQVRGQYLNRIRAKCPITKGRRYDWVIVMGGTNDLGWGQHPEAIYEGLSKSLRHRSRNNNSQRANHLSFVQPTNAESKCECEVFEILIDLEIAKVWKVALDTGANVLALNVLEAAASSPRMIEKRNQLNSMIMSHHEDRLYACFVLQSQSLHPSLLGFRGDTDLYTSYSFDLYSAIPYATLDDATKAKLWDDGLHLTGQGYKVMGDVIAVRLFEILQSLQEPKDEESASRK